MMRSELVFEAVHTLRNRYTLCQLASKATRKFHKPNTRIQDTTNEVLNRHCRFRTAGCDSRTGDRFRSAAARSISAPRLWRVLPQFLRPALLQNPRR